MQKKTERLLASEAGHVQRAAMLLRAGATVAFPTETVYGLGANALHAGAVEKIFVAKARPRWDPLIVHVAERAQLDVLVGAVPAAAEKLMELWPAPLTLLLPRTSAVPDAVTAGRSKVAVRIPAHAVAQELLRLAAVPVAAPSANLFGHTSPTSAAHVLSDLDGRIDALLDGGPTQQGVESTVVEPTEDGCVLYRPGAITAEVLERLVGRVEMYVPPSRLAEPQALPSPGVGLRHYAPRAVLTLVEAQDHLLASALSGAVRSAAEHARVGVMLPDGLALRAEQLKAEGAFAVEPWGTWQDDHSLARELYRAMRALDDAGAEQIVCPLPSAAGLGAAVVDRLRKAARR